MAFLTLLLKRLPWILLIFALVWILLTEKGVNLIPESRQSRQSLILDRIVDMGKLELVKYNFHEITELKKISAELDLKWIKLKNGPDSRAVLISRGEAAGCIDLTKITSKDMKFGQDTLFILLPEPELCYFKLDMQESRLYDLDFGYLSNEEEKQFMDELYQKAEIELRNAAIQSGIFERTLENAEIMLKPFLKDISRKEIQFTFRPEDSSIIEFD